MATAEISGTSAEGGYIEIWRPLAEAYGMFYVFCLADGEVSVSRTASFDLGCHEYVYNLKVFKSI